MARNDKDSADIRNVIRDKYIFFHMSATAIEKELKKISVKLPAKNNRFKEIEV